MLEIEKEANHGPVLALKSFSPSPCSGALLTSSAVVPAHAEEPLTNLGPVGPNEPIVIAVGGQRIIAFYQPERGGCAVSAITWKDVGADAPYPSSASSLKPGQMFQLDGAQRQSMSLFCGADASTPRRRGSRRADPHRRDRQQLAEATLGAGSRREFQND